MSLNPTSLLFLLLACPALMTLEATTSRPIEPRGQRSPRDTSNKEEPGSIKVVISEGCVTQGNSPGSEQGAKEVDLSAGSPLVLTHRITLVPSGSGAGAASSCGGGCEAQFAALRARLERLEKEVSELREKCGGEGGGCCNHQQSTGAGCTVRPEPPQCPNECSDQGRCVNGKCVCFPEFSGADCSQSNCPGDCKDQGKCVDGKCVCDPGFTGPDCSEQSCPDNCKNRGRCVNGKCVCNTGFTGPDCSEQTCPNNCKNRGQCVDGKCVCNTGFTGLDCSEQTCPDNCSGHGKCVNGKCVCDNGFIGPDCSDNRCSGNCRGRCVGGQCVCDPGFTGPDCTDKACPDSCSNQGKCVDGKCVCDVGFTGADCSAKGCPGNCNNKGRCVKGKCVCRRGFTGPDCSQCEVGLTGPDCSIVMSGVSRLSTRDITETSATLFWTPPSVQYDTYHITFTSKKEGDQQITSQTEGRQSSYNQTGLAAGLEYTATIRGEKEGRMGAESSTKFMTLISGPKNLQVVKTTTTSAVVQWGQSQGEIDRYRLTVSPNDGNGKERDMTLPADRDSAQIDQLEAGRLYDITLVAEKGKGKSKPAATQATPGPEPPSDLEFSHIAEDSLSVSWTRPKSKVSGFKVTYTHTQNGEPVSVAVGSEDTTLALSRLSPGSSYEVSVISVLGLDESDPIKDFVTTLPDPPTNLRAVNVTDTKALLLWRPALAAIDKYVIVYGTEKGSALRVTVSGNAAEQQLTGLEGSTRYTVTITSHLGAAESSPATTAFTTTSGSGEGPRDLKASQVSARSAVLSWKPSVAVGSYKLTYQTEGQEMKEVTVDASVKEYKLTRLVPLSKYTVQLQGERDGRYSSAVSTQFTTGTLRFPFPTDCSQERLNGLQESGEVEIFPQGKDGPPLLVYCDMESDGGGWTVIQRRVNGKVNFFQGWKNYSRGFGSVSEEFWLGNENLHNLTKMAPMSLRVDLRAGEEAVFAKYSSFAVDVGRKNYKLTVSGYSGTAGDSMSYHNSRPFSTKDRDPMPFITRCAMSYRGGWWYRNCHEANLNGLYGTDVNHQGIIWTAWKGKDFSIPFTEMKIRPTAFNPAA